MTALSTGWRFGRYVPGSEEPGFDDSGLRDVTVPHTVTPLSWRNWDPTAWEGQWIYRNRFDSPASSRVFIDFDGAMTHATPVLNGHPLADHLGGYLPFSREVTGLLRPEGNLLAVVLDSSFNVNVPPSRPAPYPPESVDFWQPGGLYRPVRLRTEPDVFIDDVFAKPVHVLDPARRAVVVETMIDAASVPRGDTRLTVEIAGNQATVAAAISEPGQTTLTVVMNELADVALWDVDHPNLYTVSVSLTLDGDQVHRKSVRIGFRQAEFRLDGFVLNGRRHKIFGVNRHQLYPFAGAAMPGRVQRKDAEIIRTELNCNMVRCSHYPQSDWFLDACDELGLMVWDEAPGWVYLGDDEWKALVVEDVGEMIRRDRNHPSIIIWGARINETDDDVPLYTRTNELAHRLDDSRPTAGAMSGRMDTTDYVQDVFAEDDYTSAIGPDGVRWPEFDALSPRTDRPYLVSEAVGTISGPARFYRRTDGQQTQQGQALAHARVHDLAGRDDRFCGLLAWSGIDYLSDNGPNIDQGIKYTGVVDMFRELKPGAAIYAAQVDPATRPVIAPAFYWDASIASLDTAMICSNCDSLALYVGGQHHATLAPDTATYPALRYPPYFADFSSIDLTTKPDLTINGYLRGDLVISRSFSADPAYDALSVDADDGSLDADGVDSTRVVFRVVDRYGAPRPYADGQVAISVAGPATLIGESPFDFGDTGGVGAVWIRTLPGQGGTVTVTVAHPAFGSASTVIHARSISHA
jgi:beta-galactosidase